MATFTVDHIAFLHTVAEASREEYKQVKKFCQFNDDGSVDVSFRRKTHRVPSEALEQLTVPDRVAFLTAVRDVLRDPDAANRFVMPEHIHEARLAIGYHEHDDGAEEIL